MQSTGLPRPPNPPKLAPMKRITLLFLFTALACFADEVAITKAVMLKGDHTAVSLKVGTVVELLSTDNDVLTVRYKKITGTIPASAIADASAPAEPAKKEDPKPTTPPRKAETTYGKAVEKAKENAAKHDKNVVKPTDEILGK